MIRALFITLSLLIILVQKPESKPIQRNYCTEIGRFDLMFYDDEISGSYVLLPKQSTGAIWGKLNGLEFVGRWIDGDGEGDIKMTFNKDFSWFTTSYRGDDEPDKWYIDQWHGQLRPNDNSQFEKDGKVYRCE